ncbi:MAG: nitrogen fixation protein NifH [Chloroflexi bacterium]|nr:nitrogen fixation protein NifH [Chloroflexota bacterium]
MSWKNQIRSDSLPWLLESDNPGVRYLALRDLFDLSHDDKKLKSARRSAHKDGPIAVILSNMKKEGYWVKPGPGYTTKYRSTVWAMILLAQLGASASEDKRIAQACDYLLNHMCEGGQFTTTTSGAPSGTVDCLQGNLCWSLTKLGCDNPRLDKAYEWMARTVTGDGIAPLEDKDAPVRYYAYKCGPGFACGVNNKLPCAWGGVKVMLAFSQVPVKKRTPLIKKAIQQGMDFIFSIDPSTAKYPTRLGDDKPNRAWWKFGFPVFYVTDLLQLAEAMVNLGYGNDKRLTSTLDLIREKQNEGGQWLMEYDYTGKTWLKFGRKREPNPWVTLRALKVLKAAG